MFKKDTFKLKTSWEEIRGILLWFLIAFLLSPALRKILSRFFDVSDKSLESILVQLGIPGYISSAAAYYVVSTTFLYIVLYFRFFKKNPYNTKIKKGFYIWLVIGIVYFIYSVIENKP